MPSSSSDARVTRNISASHSQNIVRNYQTSTHNARNQNQTNIRGQGQQHGQNPTYTRSQYLKNNVHSTSRWHTQDVTQQGTTRTGTQRASKHGPVASQTQMESPQVDQSITQSQYTPGTLNTQRSLPNISRRTSILQRQASSVPASRRISPTASHHAVSKSISPFLVRSGQTTTSGSSSTVVVTQRRQITSNIQRSQTSHEPIANHHRQNSDFYQIPPWVHPKSFFRPTAAEIQRERERLRNEQRRDRTPRFFRSQYHSLSKFVHRLHDMKINKFLHCIRLGDGSVMIGTLCMVCGFLSFVMLMIISTKFSDWKFVYRNKMELLVFIMYHLVITMVLFVYGTILVIGVSRESGILVKISLTGFWVHLALTWLALAALSVFCIVQGYCFQSETFAVILFKFVVTLVYTGVWLYFIWTVNSYRLFDLIEDYDEDYSYFY